MRYGDEITPKDLEKARRFLRETLEAQIKKRGGAVSKELVELVIDHSERVSAIAGWIADIDALAVNQLRLAGMLHDIGKLAGDIEGGIVGPVIHADRSKVEAAHFLTDSLHKTDDVAIAISCMVNAHSATPLTEHALNLEKPETAEEWALRDANMLDYLDLWGIALEVELRQHPGTLGYKRDKGNITESIAFARLQRTKYFEGLHSVTAKKIGAVLRKRGSRFVLFMSNKIINDLKDFRAIFREFTATEFIYKPPS